MKIKSISILLLLFLASCYPYFQAKKDVISTVSADSLAISLETKDLNKNEIAEKELIIIDYQESRKKTNSLIHTKLDLRFNWEKQYVFGKATIKLTPFYYATNKLELDAVNFDLHRVALINKLDTLDLKYVYNDMIINIELDKTYNKQEEYIIYVDYTAKPNELDNKGNRVFKDTKGLYFINPTGENFRKHQEIWTQGETQYSSCWFPTIDAPNQRCTQETFLTVQNKFTTLSNGILTNTLLNADTTRTDHWVMDKAHAPYLFMIAVGDFEKIEDEWQGMEVSYYVHPEYVDVAKLVFDKTPAMIEFFSTVFEVEYPWSKYSQIVVDDFVSGAMENTTATVFGDFMLTNPSWYSDFDREMIIAHELAHHWFGNYVTCESWANTVLNEGFATYSEYLWTEYFYGVEKADIVFSDEQYYCFLDKSNNVVNYHHDNKDDMFGFNSYQKGAWILHNLRNYVGDKAFFEATALYLNKFAYKATEIHDLRLCFEEVTGEDLNWFFNQWYFSAGYSTLKIINDFDNNTNVATVTIKQMQDTRRMPIYTLPIDFAIHLQDETIYIRKTLTYQEQTFTFNLLEQPLLIEVDPNRFLLCKRKEEKRTAEEHKIILERSTGTLAKYDAISFFEKYENNDIKRDALLITLESEYWEFRKKAIKTYTYQNTEVDKLFVEKMKLLKQNDPHEKVREAANLFLIENNE